MCVCITYQRRELERPCQEPPEGGPAGPCPCSLWSLHGRMSLSTACVCSLLEGKRRKTFTLTSSYISYHQMSIIDPLAARWQTPQVTLRPPCGTVLYFGFVKDCEGGSLGKLEGQHDVNRVFFFLHISIPTLSVAHHSFLSLVGGRGCSGWDAFFPLQLPLFSTFKTAIIDSSFLTGCDSETY